MRSEKDRVLTGFIFCLLIILSSLYTGGCLKQTVGKWDSDSVTDLEILSWTRNGNSLEVEIEMTNNNFTKLPIQSSYFNVYDEDGNLYGCSWTDYSDQGEIVEIGYKDKVPISLRFDGFNADNPMNTPDMLEYDYPNHKKQVFFERTYSEELGSGLYVVFIAATIIIATIVLIMLVRRKRNTFLE